MVKPEWGTKRTCPKCSTRFYDLAKDEPVNCISCGYAWMPEPVLKSKQPLPFEAAQPEQTVKEDEDLAAEELVPRIERRLVAALGGYGAGPMASQPGFCAPAMLENAGLEGAFLMARELASHGQ